MLLLLTIVMAGVLVEADSDRIGCYQDLHRQRDLPIALKAGFRTTRSFCIRFCRSRGFRYAGLQAGRMCTCGNSYGRHGEALDWECKFPCRGDKSQTCGGRLSNEIFTTGVKKGYGKLRNRIGCFIDRTRRDLPVKILAGSKASINFCINQCKSEGYMYAGLQAGDRCYCGNRYGRYGRARDFRCSKQCRRNPYQTCGGRWLNEIFRTRIRRRDGIRVGCFVDRSLPRDLPIALYSGVYASEDFCVKFCRSRGYRYAGIQAGSYCTCGNSFGRHGKTRDSECNIPCPRDRSRTCGGKSRNEIFTTGARRSKLLKNRLGCYLDKIPRDLPVMVNIGTPVKRESCISYCKTRGYKYAGLQAGSKCACGQKYGRYGKAHDFDCNQPCAGDRSQTCGNSMRNEIYETRINKSEGIRIGCFVDKSLPRDLPIALYSGFYASEDFCVKFCRSRGCIYAGIQAGSYCTCGNSFGRHRKTRDSECNIPCLRDRSRTCGGTWRNEIFTTGARRSKLPKNRLGCYFDKIPRDLPVMVNIGTPVKRESCISYCKTRGYKYAGLQASSKCACGQKYGRYGKAHDFDCNQPCAGDRRQTCGNSMRNEIYETGINKSD